VKTLAFGSIHRRLAVHCPVLLLMISAVTICGSTVGAHDLWIEPTTFVPLPGALIGARLRVGQDLIGDPVVRDEGLIRQFIVDDTQGRRPLVGRNRADPAGLVRVNASGLLVIGYHSHPSAVEQTAEKFAQYLTEEGLETVAALRARRGQTGAVRELFSRCAKSLVLSGSPNSTENDRSLGFTLELVAERNPYTLAPGQELPVRLTYEGQPLAGALVAALNRDTPSERLTGRSDKDGRVRFRLPRGGMWLIKAVHMIPAPRDASADWESFWASLTFELPANNATPRAPR
jgi:hypothetical protein